MENKLPKGWVETSFTEIYDIHGGTQPPKSQFIDEEKEGYIRLLQIRDFGKKPIPTYIPLTSKLRLCDVNDVVIARYGASIGRIMTGMKGAYNVAVAKVDIPEPIEKKFVWWLLKSNIFQSKITSFQRTAQSGFNKTDLSYIKLPLPPLPEQKRIVAKLDTIFSNLDALKTRLNNIPTLLKNFKQAVLTQAVTGKLTEEWRVGKALEEWEEVEINQVINSLNQGWSPKCESFPSTSDEIWGVIKTSSVQSLKFIEEENKQLPAHLEPREQHELFAGDLLITRAGPRVRVGIASLVKDARPKLMICDKVYRLRVNKKIIKPEFLEIILNSPQILAVIENMKTGISDSGLNLTQTKFKSIKLNNAPLEEQTEIVKRVESLFAKADTLEKAYTTLKQKINSLPQAILAKAFKGELVAQLDTDGDAKELLKEILKLKAAIQPVKKTKKKK